MNKAKVMDFIKRYTMILALLVITPFFATQTGGNIDLTVGSVVCFVGAIGALLMEKYYTNMWVALIIMLVIGTAIGA